MSNKLIDLSALSEYKTRSDAKYQDKLTAGSNITISNNVISAQPVGQQTLYNATITAAGWSGTSNTVSVQGIAAGDDVEIVGLNPTGLTDSQIQAAKENLGLITYGTTSANAITFYALDIVPPADIPVTLRKIINTNLTTREYYAGSGININNGVVSATPIYSNTTISRPASSPSVSAGATSTVFTATRDCKISFEVQCQALENSAKDVFVLLNGTRVYGQFQPITQKYQRIIHGFLMLKTGDIISVQNGYTNATLEFPYTVMYD